MNTQGVAVGIAVALLLAAVLGTAQQVSAGGVLTQHNDNQRSGANLAETTLNIYNVANLRQIMRLDVEGQIVAQPLYVQNIRMGDDKFHNVLYVATAANHLYAFDADNGQRIVGSGRLDGRPYRLADVDVNAGNLATPYFGITSTPVIDLESQTLFVVSKTDTDPVDAAPPHINAHFYLHALDLATLADKTFPPADIAADTATCGGAGITDLDGNSVPGIFVPYLQNNRPGLLFDRPSLPGDNRYIYIGFAGLPFDFNGYRGFVFSYSWTPSGGFTCAAAKATASANFAGAGVWQAGYGLVADPDGNVYFQTGNLKVDCDYCMVHPSDPTRCSPLLPDLGTAIIRLRGIDLAFAPEWAGFDRYRDAYIPPYSAFLNAGDFDLSSAGPMLLPKIGGFRLLGGGKQGIMTLHDLEDLSHPVQRFRATFNQYNMLPKLEYCSVARFYYPHIHGTPVFWEHSSWPVEFSGKFPLSRTIDGHVYVWGERDTLRAFSYSRANGFSLIPLRSSHVAGTSCPDNVVCLTDRDPEDAAYTAVNSAAAARTRGPNGMPGGMLSLSANGKDPYSGIVWAAANTKCDSTTKFCDSEVQFTPGVLRAFLAAPFTGNQVVLDFGPLQLWDNGAMERYFFAKFIPPTVYGGKVYLAGNTVPKCGNAIQPCGYCPDPNNCTTLGLGNSSWATDPSDVQGHVFVYGL